MPAIPAYILACCQRLEHAGHAAYPVGGCVRDLLLGKEPSDWDVATSALPRQTMSLFPGAIPTGLRHGTVTVLLEGGPVEITTFRREEGYADGRHPDTVSFDVGLYEDLQRRDFTINAMALSAEGEIIDPFGARDDLARKIIRCVGDPAARFREDALRMLRAVRFSAQLGFEIEPATRQAVSACAWQAAQVSPERVRAEVEKTITAPEPERGNLLFSLGLLRPWLDEPATPDLTSLRRLPSGPLYRWSGLCALLGGTGLLNRLRPDRRTAALCEKVLHALHGGVPETGIQWRRALAAYGEEVLSVAAALWKREEEFGRVLATSPCYTVRQLALTGGQLREMGLLGAAIGAAQQRLLEHVLEHPEDNDAAVLRRLAEETKSD